ncbi:hypothetical protein EG328_009639 [Venturia inaequalis]|uniref:Uncharacterized protein n=1 Tax=Venturia inaequalis TaxID=5025 RepID=A0A8H3YQ33_VENIN|nr:hypothetical protein EG328_009639 [Venturia inaequalis]RDI86528.1 hypothetical protein Vi05172_g3313 [Venturia inaequalis]
MENPIPRKFFLFTYPRTASNLPTKILSPENQPSLLKSKFEYFFAPTLAWKLGPAQLGGKPFSAWSEDWKTGLRQSFTECAQTLADACKKAEEEGKDIYIKEHVNWLLDPVVESLWAFGNTEMGTDNTTWTIGANILPGGSQTHSPGNETIFSDEFLMSWR